MLDDDCLLCDHTFDEMFHFHVEYIRQKAQEMVDAGLEEDFSHAVGDHKGMFARYQLHRVNKTGKPYAISVYLKHIKGE